MGSATFIEPDLRDPRLGRTADHAMLFGGRDREGGLRMPEMAAG